MGIDLNDVDRLLIIERINTGNVDRVIATEHDRQRAGLQYFADAIFDISVAIDRIGVNDVRIADIDDPDGARRQVGDIILVVVGAGMAE